MYFQDQAIILFSQPQREYDLLIKAYTSKYGKIILKARGAQKIISKLAGHLQPITLSELNWVSGKSSHQLTGAETISSFSNLKKDIVRTSYALYFLELVDLSSQPEHPDQKIFGLLISFLDWLEKVPPQKLKITSLIFIYKLLAILGLSPLLKKNPDSDEFKLLRQIISAPTVDTLELNFSEKNLVHLSQDAQQFLSEAFEVEIKTGEFLKKIK